MVLAACQREARWDYQPANIKRTGETLQNVKQFDMSIRKYQTKLAKRLTKVITHSGQRITPYLITLHNSLITNVLDGLPVPFCFRFACLIAVIMLSNPNAPHRIKVFDLPQPPHRAGPRGESHATSTVHGSHGSHGYLIPRYTNC